jgi:purine-binding chemotaxis protein CheW
MNKDLHVIGFSVGRETFGVPIALVREIVRVPQITAVPNVPDYIVGVINLRGRIVPVIDLRKRLGEKEVGLSKKSRILVVELADRLVGMIVNSASEVLKIPPSEIEAPPAVAAGGQPNYVTGVGKLHGRLIILLDLVNLLQGGELQYLGESPAPAATTA